MSYPPTTIRISPAEYKEAMKKAKAFGVRTLAEIIRLSLRNLRVPEDQIKE